MKRGGPPIISVVGRTGSGKTTFIEKLVAELKKRGYGVATIKHSVNQPDIDHPGKDTWRHARAGAETVLIVSANNIAMIKKGKRKRSLDELAAWLLPDEDIVITEGFKKGKKPKIEVLRKDVGEELLCSREELLAVVSDFEIDLDVPLFSFDDARGVADLIEKRFSLKPPIVQ